MIRFPSLCATATAIAAALFAAPTLAEQVCVEEVAGVCLKYRTVEPAKPAAPTTTTARPAASPEATAERRLGLTREERRAIQETLSGQGWYGGGIDGAFGPGTRRAIRLWQRENGSGASGYLTENDVAALFRQRREAIQRESGADVAVAEPAATEPEVTAPPPADPKPGETYSVAMVTDTRGKATFDLVANDSGVARIAIQITGDHYERTRATCEFTVGVEGKCLFQAQYNKYIMWGTLPNLRVNQSDGAQDRTFFKSRAVDFW